MVHLVQSSYYRETLSPPPVCIRDTPPSRPNCTERPPYLVQRFASSHAARRLGVPSILEAPLSSEFKTNKPFEARFGPWLEPF